VIGQFCPNRLKSTANRGNVSARTGMHQPSSFRSAKPNQTVFVALRAAPVTPEVAGSSPVAPVGGQSSRQCRLTVRRSPALPLIKPPKWARDVSKITTVPALPVSGVKSARGSCTSQGTDR
jgi:hypothetical protein